MKVFVVGATGYLGFHLSCRLKARGHEVTGLARSAAGVAKLRAFGLDARLGDAAGLDPLVEAARAADATVFAPQLTLEEEHATVTALVEGCRGTGKTFVFTSGTGVLGQRTGGAWSPDSFAEGDVFDPAPTLVRRIETEALVRNAGKGGVRGLVVRPPMVWGRGRFAALDLIAQSIRATGDACYVGAGLNLYSHVYIEDLAELYALALDRGKGGALYHAVSGELAFRLVAHLLAARIGRSPRSVSLQEAVGIWGKFATYIVLAASSRSRSPRAHEDLGWRPTRFDLIDEILEGNFDALKGLTDLW